MVNKISAPYNFVPLNKFVFVPDWGGDVSQDIPFADGEDGYIEVTWKNVSPLCVRDASGTDDKNYSMHVKMSDGSRLYFIPGSSLRGMLRNTLSVMSFGRLTQYGNKYFGHREFHTKKTDNNEYQNQMSKVRYGWLEGDYDGYKLYMCIGEADKISIKEVREIALDREYDKYKYAWERNQAIGNNTFPKKEKDGIVYRVFATGQMHNKNNELLIPEADENSFVRFCIDDEAITSFFTVYSNTSGFENYRAMLECGKRIPVSFIKDGSHYVLGMGRMMRYPHKYSVADLIENVQKRDDAAGRDLADVIFGWVDRDHSLKGRVQIGNAFASRPLRDEELCSEVRGVLGTPKPSFYPLYLKQDERPYKTYSTEGATISGTKRYRIHKGASVTTLPQGNGNIKTMSQINPVPAGQTFKMRIVVHNMRKMEIGALLSAITFNHTQGTYHNIGSAKGFGYGKMECADLSLHGFAFSEEEYLKEFEYVMSQFTKAKYSCLWSETTQVKSLVAIMSEHEDNDVRMMEMDKNRSPLQKNEYEYYKTNFSKLEETAKSVTTYLNDDDVAGLEESVKRVEAARLRKRFVVENAKIYDDIKADVKSGNFQSAIESLDRLINDMLIQGVDKSDEETWRTDIVEKQKAKEAEETQKKVEALNEKKKQQLSGGLANFIEEKNPLTDKYKVDKWKTCDSKIKQWLKKKNTSSLDDDEKQTLEKTIRRLYVEQDRSEKKDWKVEYDKNKIWKAIRGYLGEERAMSLYKSMEG